MNDSTGLGAFGDGVRTGIGWYGSRSRLPLWTRCRELDERLPREHLENFAGGFERRLGRAAVLVGEVIGDLPHRLLSVDAEPDEVGELVYDHIIVVEEQVHLLAVATAAHEYVRGRNRRSRIGGH
jgi:hypothetical protein